MISKIRHGVSSTQNHSPGCRVRKGDPQHQLRCHRHPGPTNILFFPCKVLRVRFTYMFVYIYIYTYTYKLCAYTRLLPCKCRMALGLKFWVQGNLPFVCTYIHTCIHTYIYMCVCAYVHLETYDHVYVCMYIYIYISTSSRLGGFRG